MVKESSIVKVVHIITSLDAGGAERVLLDTIKYSSQHDMKHFVVSMMKGGSLLEDVRQHAPVFFLGMSRGIPSFRALLKLRKILKGVSPDVVQGWMYHGNLMAVIVKYFVRNVKVFWAIHHSLSDIKGERLLTKLIIRFSKKISGFTNGIVYVSAASARQHESIGYSSARTRIIPNGINIRKFRKIKDSIRSELNISKGIPIVSLIARFHLVKDHATFFMAVANIMEKSGSIHFILAGKDVSDENEYFLNLLSTLKYPRNIHLLGERRDINNLLSATTVAVNCSKSEAFPISVAEAMACEVPCVVSDVGDSAYLLGGNGAVIPPGDAKVLADAILRLLGDSNAQLSLIGKSARERIKTKFSIESVVNQYRELYREDIATL